MISYFMLILTDSTLLTLWHYVGYVTTSPYKFCYDTSYFVTQGYFHGKYVYFFLFGLLGVNFWSVKAVEEIYVSEHGNVSKTNLSENRFSPEDYGYTSIKEIYEKLVDNSYAALKDPEVVKITAENFVEFLNSFN